MTRLMAFVVLAALAGCGALRDALPHPGKPAAPAANPSGQPLFSSTPIVTEPGLEVTLLALGTTAELSRSGQNGSVTTWASRDGISVSYDRGVLVATRGLGDDLMAADAGPTLAALAGRPGEYRRTMRYLDAEDHARYILLGCTMESLGPDRGRRGLVRNEETCRSFTAEHVNIYWTDGAGRIVASHQWISDIAGEIVASAPR